MKSTAFKKIIKGLRFCLISTGKKFQKRMLHLGKQLTIRKFVFLKLIDFYFFSTYLSSGFFHVKNAAVRRHRHLGRYSRQGRPRLSYPGTAAWWHVWWCRQHSQRFQWRPHCDNGGWRRTVQAWGRPLISLDFCCKISGRDWNQKKRRSTIALLPFDSALLRLSVLRRRRFRSLIKYGSLKRYCFYFTSLRDRLTRLYLPQSDSLLDLG